MARRDAIGGGGDVRAKARPYQLELLDAAIDENTIVALGTGAGKTFIAVMLIREFLHQLYGSIAQGAKRTVFLVPTVPLVKQQAEYIRDHLPPHYKVATYTGDMNVDSWSDAQWKAQLEDNHVLVMTKRILLNMLQGGFIHLRKINLIVLDECHHAVKSDDYVQIMKMFDSCKDELEYPRVLGLTASILPSKCKPGELEKKIRGLEEILRSRAQTARDLDDVVKYAARPTEKMLYYRYSSADGEVTELLEGVVSEFFSQLPRATRKKQCVQMVKSDLEDALHILVNLGLWSAHKYALEATAELEHFLEDNGAYFEKNLLEQDFVSLGITQLKQFHKRLLALLQLQPYDTSPKVMELIRFLETWNRTQTQLLGIVFVERRTTAIVLTRLLQKLFKDKPSLRHMTCDFVVGHNSSGAYDNLLRRSARMNIKKQEKVLDRFRENKMNLLVATSVVEEGVDVPKCNLVVRFDLPQNFRAYIQSKGRARARGSQFVLLVDAQQKARQEETLCNFRELEKQLGELCHKRHAPGEEEFLKHLEDMVPPYEPFGKEAGVRVTLSTSLSKIHEYCQKLPSDRYTFLAPLFDVTKLPDREIRVVEVSSCQTEQLRMEFSCSLQLPMNCPVKADIQGDPMPTAHYAKKSAALRAVKILHEAGEMDNHLRPVSRKEEVDSDAEDEEKMKEKKANHSGTERRSQHYRNKVAEVLKGCSPKAAKCWLYYFVIREGQEEEDKLYQSTVAEGSSHPSWAVLTSKQLPHYKLPRFSLYVKEKELYVSVEKYHCSPISLSTWELDMLKAAHVAIFKELLNFRLFSVSSDESERDYLVVPVEILQQTNPKEVFIDMELATTIATMDNQPLTTPRWPCNLEKFINGLVAPNHRKSYSNNQESSHISELYSVSDIDFMTTPLSPFPGESYETYAHYYSEKYNYVFEDLTQPALKCRKTGTKERTFLTSRYKTSKGESLEKSASKSNEIKLFPEACELHKLSANVWHLVQCLPSLLWRLESLLLVEELQHKVSLETGIGLAKQGEEITTQTQLRGYEDQGFGCLVTQKISPQLEQCCALSPSQEQLCSGVARGPDNALLLQALTFKGANDSINLERLETLGDSFLKLATSVHLFSSKPQAHEGKLTEARSRRVGNFNLYHLAKKKSLPSYILSSAFKPLEMWVPPCLSLEERSIHTCGSPSEDGATPVKYPKKSFEEFQQHFLHHKATDKGVADCVESLIGAYLVSGGIGAAITFMKWVGLKLGVVEQEEAMDDDTSQEPSPPKRPKVHFPSLTATRDPFSFLIGSTQELFNHHFPYATRVTCSDRLPDLLKNCSAEQVQETIGWWFSNPSLLLQALTHASYTRNRITDCYQRLEFLGDAILDYLITIHIYCTFPKYGPGQISSMRSALVNNVTFAEFSVELGLDKCVLYNSQTLYDDIPAFSRLLEKIYKTTNTEADDQMDIDGGEVEEGLGGVREGEGEGEEEEMEEGEVRDEEEEEGEEEEEEEEGEKEAIDAPKVLGDILESLAGAVFLDSGMSLECVWGVFSHLIKKRIEKYMGNIPVTPVQQLFQMEPQATITSKRKGGFTECTATIARKSVKESAKNRSPKAAKHSAARKAIERLKSIAEKLA